VIAAGFGFRASATAASLDDAFQRALGAAGVSAVQVVAAPADKAATAQFATLATQRAVPSVAVAAEALEAAQTQTRSEVVLAARSTGSVAEAAALVAAGPGARLLAPRVISGDKRATCAVAIGGGAA